MGSIWKRFAAELALDGCFIILLCVIFALAYRYIDDTDGMTICITIGFICGVVFPDIHRVVKAKLLPNGDSKQAESAAKTPVEGTQEATGEGKKT